MTIIKSTHTRRYKRHQHGDYVDGVSQTGLDLLMQDGSVWFHPFDGSAPRRIS